MISKDLLLQKKKHKYLNKYLDISDIVINMKLLYIYVTFRDTRKDCDMAKIRYF